MQHIHRQHRPESSISSQHIESGNDQSKQEAQIIIEKGSKILNRDFTANEIKELTSFVLEIDKERTLPEHERPLTAYEWSPDMAEVTNVRIPLDRLQNWGDMLSQKDEETKSLKKQEILNFQLQQIKSHMQSAILNGEKFEKWLYKYLILVDNSIQKQIEQKGYNLKNIYEALEGES